LKRSLRTSRAKIANAGRIDNKTLPGSLDYYRAKRERPEGKKKKGRQGGDPHPLLEREKKARFPLTFWVNNLKD